MATSYAPATTRLLRSELRRLNDRLARDRQTMTRMPKRSRSQLAEQLRERILATEVETHDLSRLLSITEGKAWVSDWPARVEQISREIYTLYVADERGAYIATMKRFDGAPVETAATVGGGC